MFHTITKSLQQEATYIDIELRPVPNPLLSGEATENNSSVKVQFGSITVKKISDAIARSKLLRALGRTTSPATS